MSRNAIVYESRNRLTGTLMRTVDTKHPGALELALPKRPKGQETFRYAALCVEHKKVVFFAEHYPAGRAIAHPDEWCEKCIAMIAANKKLPTTRNGQAAVTPPVVLPVAAKPAVATKRTSSRQGNRAARRRQAAQQVPGPVVVTQSPETSDDELATTEEIEQLAETLNGNGH